MNSNKNIIIDGAGIPNYVDRECEKLLSDWKLPVHTTIPNNGSGINKKEELSLFSC